MTAVIYARYSSDMQSETSIDAQVRACREYAAQHDLNIINIYADEAVSGKGSQTSNRKQYQKMLKDAEHGSFNVILIHKYDRVARSLAEHVNLESKLKRWDVQLIGVAQDFGNSKEAKIMRTMMWSLSEYYIDNLSEETKKGLRETALKGLHNGGYPPFGYDVVNQKYVINEREADYVRKLFDAASARKGFKPILEEMQAAGITGKRGKIIKYTQVYEILHNEKYTGVYLYSPQEERQRKERRDKPHAIRIENALPVIISRAQFKEVQKIMSERKQAGRKGGYLCSGLVYCECGAKMHALVSHRKGHEYRYYSCSAKCGAPMIRVDDVDTAAFNYLHTLLSDENQEKIAQSMLKYQAEGKNREEVFNAVLKKRINEKQYAYDALMKNLASGALPPEVVSDIGAQMSKLKTDIAVLEATQPPQDYTLETIRQWLEALKANPDEQAIHLLVERISIKPKTVSNIQSTLNTVLGNIGCGDGI